MTDLNKINKIFILGIKGVAMTNIAIILKKQGKEVFGWDVEEEFITDTLLKKHKIKVLTKTDAKNLSSMINRVDLIIYSAAHGGINHPLVKNVAKEIPSLHQAEVLGKIMKQFCYPIAVCGSHGKTTTSALLSHALIKLNQKPSYIVGTSQFNQYDGGDFNPPSKTNYFIAEADEYGLNPPKDKTPKFYFFNPKFIIATNIDFDHPDVYENLEIIKNAFYNFFDKRKIIACGDDIGLVSVLKKLKQENYLTYGFDRKNNYQIVDYQTKENFTQFLLRFPNGERENFQTKIFGKMNIVNTTGVITLLHQFGYNANQIATAIENFTGAKRRFELVYQGKKIAIFDDYAHHPKEIISTLEAARLRFPEKRIIVIFQPHTFSRTQALIKEFNQALSQADLAFVLPIFPSAREDRKSFAISSQDIIEANNRKKNLIYAPNSSSLLNKLKQIVKINDIIFTMGAGNVYQFTHIIKKQLNDN
jgi:UDP-N-acetylmuramate--alanine ligase